MIKKLIIKLFHSLLLILLFVFTLILLLNVFSTQLINSYLKNSITKGVDVHISKVNKILLPLFIEAEGLIVKTDGFSIFIKKIDINLDVKDYFNKKPFIVVKINSPRLLLSKKGNSNKNIDLTFLKKIFFFKTVEIKDLVFHDETNNLLVSDEQILLSNNNRIDIVSKNIFIKKDDLLSKIEAVSTNCQIISGKIRLNNLIVKGDDVDVQLSATLSNESYDIEGMANIKGKLLNILYKDLNGALYVQGAKKKNQFDVSVYSDNITYKNKKIDFTVALKGDDKSLYFKSDKVVYDNYSFIISGFSDYKFVNGEIIGLKPVNLYQDKKYHVLLEKLKFDLNIKQLIGNVKFFIKSSEYYQVSSDFKINDKGLNLDKILLSGKTVNLLGSGNYKDKSLSLNLTGHLQNNTDLKKIIDIDHDLNVNINLILTNNKPNLTAVFKSNKSTTYHGLSINKISGDLSYDGKALKLNTQGVLNRGVLNISGIIDKYGEQFDISLESTPFNSILKYFGVSSKINNLVDGKVNIVRAGDNIFANGEVYNIEDLNHLKLWFEYRGKKLLITKLKYFGNEYNDVGFLDFDKKIINTELVVDDNLCISKSICLSKSRVNIMGDIEDPDVKVALNGSYLKYKFYGNVNGKLKKLYGNIYVKDENIHTSFSLSNFINLKDTLYIQGFKASKDVVISSIVNINSSDLKHFDIYSFSTLINVKNNIFTLKGITGKLSDNKAILTEGLIDSDYIKNIKIERAEFDKEGFRIILSPAKINFKDMVVLNMDGDIVIEGDYKNIKVNADINGKGDLKLPKYGINLNILFASIILKDEKISSIIYAKKLDEKLYISLRSDDFKYLDSYALSVQGENFFISKSGFSGTLNYSLEKNKNSDTVKGEIFIKNGILDYKKIDSSTNSNEKISLPINLEIEIGSVHPIILKDDFVDAQASVDIKVNYNKSQLKLRGKIESVESYLKLAGEKFYVEKGYLTFSDDKPPYIYTKASGTGSFNNLFITVYGHLPSYVIAIEDMNPNNSETVYNKSQIQSKNVISSFFTGTLLKELTKYTERLFGINKIGLEETSVAGSQMKDYFKIGRKFSDRFEIKYLVDTQGTGGDYITGEYLIFDWLKFNVNYSNLEGTGAGITFFINY
ncbi:hypothetical protein DEFDS_0016 [Deferribacter desulfuricans SSM1]|uniref:Translocation and assembly module TamB C-terminal domain-containing protein n=1 Tax=Deferribacter desulfuricans (strain DSM 14783 / JCM 11476 / NBRC 101012 / SSM1) TaxID=639282 RepID=D3PAA5_DEFDS|nr:translocation/assembly module TamB domain-containing protein [Deferribacter desulfuricans]BAI79528.1 hypothetical protein DEFDS_0016 [Deferribacter desulfuricans SSM1]